MRISLSDSQSCVADVTLLFIATNYHSHAEEKGRRFERCCSCILDTAHPLTKSVRHTWGEEDEGEEEEERDNM